MIPIIRTPHEFRKLRKTPEWNGRGVGFVPTMGALHEGHASLFQKSCVENQITVASIFVNPTQFNDPKDLEKYPRTLEQDLKILEKNGVNYLFHPSFDAIYPDSYRYKISENDFSKMLCGAHRPGHFDGVLTVVMKLLQIVKPQRAYFGEKDYQQLELIRGMVESFFLDVEIVGCPTVREVDGLAMSSRNQLLTQENRSKAVRFPELLRSQESPSTVRKHLEEEGFRVDYVEDIGSRRFGAVFLGNVRLIDNVQR